MRGLILIAAFLAGLASAQAQPSQGRVTIDVMVAPHKMDGSAWDGLAGGAGGRGAFSAPIPQSFAPPDPAVCIVELAGTLTCYPEPVGGRLRPKCQDRFQCRFEGVRIPQKQTFALIIVDVDMRLNDLVDYIFLYPGESSSEAESEKLKAVVLPILQRLTPALYPSTRRGRAMNEVETRSLRECAIPGAKCKGLQSEFTLIEE